jgi:hypothetical protein
MVAIPRGEWTDETVMPWGKHKGTKLEDIPAGYFLWLMEQPWLPDWPGLNTYIKKNADALYQQAEEEDDAKGSVDDDDGYRNYEDFKRDFHGF